MYSFFINGSCKNINRNKMVSNGLTLHLLPFDADIGRNTMETSCHINQPVKVSVCGAGIIHYVGLSYWFLMHFLATASKVRMLLTENIKLPLQWSFIYFLYVSRCIGVCYTQFWKGKEFLYELRKCQQYRFVQSALYTRDLPFLSWVGPCASWCESYSKRFGGRQGIFCPGHGKRVHLY